jgi:polysaccharide export outer membrane protein
MRRSPAAGVVLALAACLGSAAARQDVAGGDPPALPEAALTVGAGDVLLIDVLGVDELDRRVRVSDDGTVNLPLLGSVEIGGLRVGEVERLIAALLAERDLVKRPEVSVFVEESVSTRVTVQGAVALPGAYPLVSSTTLLEILARAGGVAGDSVGGNILVLRRRAGGDHERIEIDAVALLRLGDPASNIRVEPGDLVIVPRPRLVRVYVTGAVARPGSVEYSSGDGITVLQAIIAAGGPKLRAKLRNVQVMRRGPGGEQRFTVDAKAILRGAAEDVALEPNDTVLVGAGFP